MGRSDCPPGAKWSLLILREIVKDAGTCVCVCVYVCNKVKECGVGEGVMLLGQFLPCFQWVRNCNCQLSSFFSLLSHVQNRLAQGLIGNIKKNPGILVVACFPSLLQPPSNI